MASCSKCQEELNANRLQATFLIENNGLKVITIVSKYDRILISKINKSKVRVRAGSYYDVYANDLHYWITELGLNGITFPYPDQEEDFLATYADIRKFHYS